MTDWTHLQNLDPSKLARMLDLEDLVNWTQDDPAAILRHQLAAPLLPDLLLAPGSEESRLRALVQDLAGANFLDQLTAPNPSLELLHAIKAFARHVRDDPANPLHGTPADILYYAAIAAALVNCNERITTLTDADLRSGLTWALRRPGVDPMRPILQAAYDKLPV